MSAIEVEFLAKEYQVFERKPGLWGSIASVFWREWKRVRAVDSISFRIEEGELVGFLGANGAGKTTTLKMLSGLLTPSSGNVQVLGFHPWKREREFQRQISLVMGQRTQLWWEIPAQETFRLNQAIYGLSEKEYRQSLDELVEMLDLKDCLSVPVKKLSLGQRMRAELAAALLHRPKILLLDEPTLGLDVVMQKKVREFILDYNRKWKASILLTSHNMDDLAALCPRVLMLEKGKIIYDGGLEQLVRRYAENKVIRMVFDEHVSPAKVAAFGAHLDSLGTSALISVPRSEVSKKAALFLSSFPIADLTIEEVAVDEIVRTIFSQT